MKIAALLVAPLAIAAAVAGIWLFVVTLNFALGPEYALFSGMASTIVGGGALSGLLDDGFGIFIPSVILLGIAYFFGKFAWNLWRD